MLTPEFGELGIKQEINRVNFAEMLRDYYRQNGPARKHNLFFLATNFYQTFDPYLTYHTGDAWQGVFNTSGLRSEKLMNAAGELRQMPADSESYRQMWLKFQAAWRAEMPTAPIYSNVYFDLSIPELLEYYPSAHVGFSDAIMYATLAD
jgi:ABC-type transport system substrate-binding protein